MSIGMKTSELSQELESLMTDQMQLNTAGNSEVAESIKRLETVAELLQNAGMSREAEQATRLMVKIAEYEGLK